MLFKHKKKRYLRSSNQHQRNYPQ